MERTAGCAQKNVLIPNGKFEGEEGTNYMKCAKNTKKKIMLFSPVFRLSLFEYLSTDCKFHLLLNKVTFNIKSEMISFQSNFN